MNYFQSEMPLLADIKREQELLSENMEHLLDDIASPHQAILFAMQYAGRTQTSVGDELELQKSHWSGIVRGNKNMSWKLKDRLMDLLGNDILLQWYAWKRGYRLVRREQSKEQRLQQQIEDQQRRIEELEQQNERQQLRP